MISIERVAVDRGFGGEMEMEGKTHRKESMAVPWVERCGLRLEPRFVVSDVNVECSMYSTSLCSISIYTPRAARCQLPPIPIPLSTNLHPPPPHTTPPPHLPSINSSTPQLRNDKRKKHPTRLPKHGPALHHGHRHLIPPRLRYQQPDGEDGDGKEVVEEDEGLADYAGEETDGAVDALAAALEVAETAELEGF